MKCNNEALSIQNDDINFVYSYFNSFQKNEF